MRLQRLLIERYGCFERADLAFATEPGRINLVLASNGAGKSVLRQAVHDLLFDIPLQTPMKFRHGYPGMALRAEALAADGTRFGFGWVRQGKPPRVTTDAARYAALRNAITPLQLERLFALDTAALRKGGTDLKGGTTLAGALLAGTGELAPAKAVRAEIEARRQANWGPGKSKPPLNAAVAALEIARKSARAAVQRPQQRERQERELDEQRARHARARQDHEHARAATRRLHRIALTRGHLLALAQAEAWFEANPAAPALPAGLDARLAAARGAIATTRAMRTTTQQALDAASAEADKIERDAVVGQFGDLLARLPGMLGEAEKAARDIVVRRAERAAALGLVRTALRDIGLSMPEEQAGSAVPPVAIMTQARDAITAHAAWRKALDLAEVRSKRATRNQSEAELQTTASIEVPDGLSALLQEVRAGRNPVQHAAELAETLGAARAALRAALARVPGWASGAQALRALALPAEAVFDRLDGDRRDAAAEHRDRQAELARLEAGRASTAKRLESLRERPLPDAAAIAAARAQRDRGWRLIVRRAFSTEPPDAAAERAYAGAEPLPLTYERAVQAADDLADRRSAELDRVVEADRLGRERADFEAGLVVAGRAEANEAARLERAREAWAACCLPCCLDGRATMADVRDFAAARTRAIEAMRVAEMAEDAAASLSVTHAAWAARVAGLLGMADQQLPALLAVSDARIAAAHAAVKAIARQQAQLEATRRELKEAEAALTGAQEEAVRWEEGWAATLTRLGRPAGERPEVTAAVLDRIATLDQHDREATSLARRIADMQADLDRFASDVTGLAGAMGHPGVPDPAVTARALIARVDRAAAASSSWNQAQVTLRQSREALAEADAALWQAQLELDATVAAAGADSPEDADARIIAAREHARHAAMRDSALAGLLEHGDGQTRATLRNEAHAVPAEMMTVQCQAAEAAATDAGARAETAAVDLDRLQTAFEAETAATGAVETRADYEAAATHYARRLEEQLVLNVASAMLAQAMQTVEQALGGSSLDRVSQAFGAVTDGAYGIAVAEDGPDGEALYAVEHAHPRERKELHELSEGTRDQLYLALRLVALRDHCASATPLPFIADDILQTFDDDRAKAALLALVALSADLQVIVLTHHPHLVRLAQTLPAGCVELLAL